MRAQDWLLICALLVSHTALFVTVRRYYAGR